MTQIYKEDGRLLDLSRILYVGPILESYGKWTYLCYYDLGYGIEKFPSYFGTEQDAKLAHRDLQIAWSRFQEYMSEKQTIIVERKA